MKITKSFRVLAAGSIVACAMAALPALPAQANGPVSLAEQMINLNAEVEELCEVNQPFDSALHFPVSAGRPTADSITSDTRITCNTPASIELESQFGGMMHTGSRLGIQPSLASANYIHSFDYTAKITHAVGGDLVTLDTNDGAFGAAETAEATPDTLNADNIEPDMLLTLELTAQQIDASKILRGGDYNDTLFVRVIPQ